MTKTYDLDLKVYLIFYSNRFFCLIVGIFGKTNDCSRNTGNFNFSITIPGRNMSFNEISEFKISPLLIFISF